MNSDLNSVQIADIFWLLLITILSKSDSDLMHVTCAFIADLPIVRGEEFEWEEFKVSSDGMIGWGATVIFKLSKMKLFRASQSSVVHVEAVLTSNQSPV